MCNNTILDSEKGGKRARGDGNNRPYRGYYTHCISERAINNGTLPQW